MYLIQVRDGSGKFLGNFAGVEDGAPCVNRSLLCGSKFVSESSAADYCEKLNEWAGGEFVGNVKEMAV